ncbi:MAG TPA: methyl-coenzyme M reductase operon protein D [Methanoregula sp.]|nr:methyl-coenzyme M reductase operon protein D [Methanoregula sp.]
MPARFLFPETAERLLNAICKAGVVRRMVLNGPRLPATVTEGPGRGLPNPHPGRKIIHVGGEEFELQVQVGTILLELENADAIPQIRQVCDEVFINFSYTLQEGKFMKSQMTVSDYAKYGVMEDERILGIADPKAKGSRCPIILQGNK